MSATPTSRPEENFLEETLIENCLLDLLKTHDLPQAIIPGSADIPHHFVSIIAAVGGVLNYGPVPGQDELEPDLLGLSITFELVTPRPPQTVVAPIETLRVHERYLGRLRNLLRRRNAPFANLANHRIDKLERQLPSRDFDGDLWADKSRQVFIGELIKLPGAFSANPTPAS